jgi:uncharacterized protein YjbI with pentapeptide repeats
MPSRIKAEWSRLKEGLDPHRVGIGPGIIALGIILVAVVAWNPAFHFYTDPGIRWREKLATVAAILVCVGLLVAVRRFRQDSKGSQDTEDSTSAGGEKPAPQKQRDWVAIVASNLSGLAAVIALIFTALSVQATKGQLHVTQHQLQVAEQGQITDRYNAAIANLASGSIDVRLGGIYALQRLMQDSPRDQATIVAVLCAFARDKIASNTKPQKSAAPKPQKSAAPKPQKSAAPKPQTSPAPSLPTDAQAALTVVGTRKTANDGHTIAIDLNHVVLTGAQLERMHFAGANLAGATLTGANLSSTDLTGATLTGTTLTSTDLTGANLTGTTLTGAKLDHATLTDTKLTGANLTDASLDHATLADTNLAGANLLGANLVGAELSHENMPNLSLIGANLSGADLSGANLSQGNLTGAVLVRVHFNNAILNGVNLTGANLTGAILREAILTGANLANANLTSAYLYAAILPRRANLTGVNPRGAYWPQEPAPVPEGWQRIPGSHYLKP